MGRRPPADGLPTISRPARVRGPQCKQQSWSITSSSQEHAASHRPPARAGGPSSSLPQSTTAPSTCPCPPPPSPLAHVQPFRARPSSLWLPSTTFDLLRLRRPDAGDSCACAYQGASTLVSSSVVTVFRSSVPPTPVSPPHAPPILGFLIPANQEQRLLTAVASTPWLPTSALIAGGPTFPPREL